MASPQRSATQWRAPVALLEHRRLPAPGAGLGDHAHDLLDLVLVRRERAAARHQRQPSTLRRRFAWLSTAWRAPRARIPVASRQRRAGVATVALGSRLSLSSPLHHERPRRPRWSFPQTIALPRAFWNAKARKRPERGTERHPRGHSMPSQLQRGVTPGVQRNIWELS
jgi:hypothetical protein